LFGNIVGVVPLCSFTEYIGLLILTKKSRRRKKGKTPAALNQPTEMIIAKSMPLSFVAKRRSL
jgi:hypothetical protein